MPVTNDQAWIVGEFVETVQLQVVCETLLKKLPPGDTEITEEHLKAYGNIEAALRFFYEDSLREAIDNTRDVVHNGTRGINEGALRNWFEKKLITPAGTRGLAYRGATSTEGLINEAVDVLDRAHIIREERRGASRWYELSHDRFINPILDSNKAWLLNFSSAFATRELLEKRAALWAASHADKDFLDQGELPEAERWIASPEARELGFDAMLPNFVLASRTHQINEEEQKRLTFENALNQARAAKRFQYLSYALAGVVFLMIGLVVFSWIEWQKAKANATAALESEKRARRAESDVKAHDAKAVEWAERESKARKDADAAKADLASTNEKLDRERKNALDAARRANAAKDEAQRERVTALIAKKATEDALDLARKRDDIAFNARTAFRLARTSDRKEEAITKLDEARKLYESSKAESDRYAANDILLNIGEIYIDMGNETQAGKTFQQAIQRAHGTFERAETLNSIGDIYRDAPSWLPSAPPILGVQAAPVYQPTDKAIENYRQAYELYEQLNDTFDQAQTAIKLGLAEYNSTSYKPNDEKTQKFRSQAFAHLVLGRNLFQQLEDHRGTGYALLQIARVNRTNAGPFTPEIKASYIAALEQALNEYILAKDDKGQITVLKELAPLVAGQSKEDVEKAAKLFTQLAAAYERRGDSVNEALTLIQEAYSVGWFAPLPERNKFMTYLFSAAAQLLERAGESEPAAQVLMTVGRGFISESDTVEAASAFKKASDLFARGGHHDQQIAALAGLFDVYFDSSRPQAELYLIQIEALGKMGDKSVRAIALQTLGSAHLRLGQKDRAAQEFEESVALVHASGDASAEGLALQQIAGYYYGSDPNKSIEWDQRAVALYHNKNLMNEAFALQSIGRAYQRLGQFESAEKYFRQGIEVFHQPGNANPFSEGNAWIELGQMFATKDPNKAIGFLQEAVKLYRSRQLLPDEARALREIASVYRKNGNTEKANEYERQANEVTNSPIQMAPQVRN